MLNLLFLICEVYLIHATSFLSPDISGIAMVKRHTVNGSRFDYFNNKLFVEKYSMGFEDTESSINLVDHQLLILDTKKGHLDIAFIDNNFRQNIHHMRSSLRPQHMEFDPNNQNIYWIQRKSSLDPIEFVTATLSLDKLSIENQGGLTSTLDGCDFVVATTFGYSTADSSLWWIACRSKVFVIKFKGSEFSKWEIDDLNEESAPIVGMAFDSTNKMLVVARQSLFQSSFNFYNVKTDVDDPAKIIDSKNGNKFHTSSSIAIKKMQVVGDYLYYLHYNDDCIAIHCRSIVRVPIARGKTNLIAGNEEFVVTADTEGILLDKFFSPQTFHVYKSEKGDHHLCWHDAFTGLISIAIIPRPYTPNSIRVTIFDQVSGRQSIGDIALVTEAPRPIVVLTNPGMKSICFLSMGNDQEGHELKELTKTESIPTSIVYVPKLEVLFWSEPFQKCIIVFDYKKKRVITKLSYPLSPTSFFDGLSYSAKTKRLFATDRPNKQIVSWEYPHDEGSSISPRIDWRTTDDRSVPRNLQIDYQGKCLYFIDHAYAQIYVLFLQSTTSKANVLLPPAKTMVIPTAAAMHAEKARRDLMNDGRRVLLNEKLAQVSIFYQSNDLIVDQARDHFVSDLWLYQDNLYWNLIGHENMKFNNLIAHSPLLKDNKSLAPNFDPVKSHSVYSRESTPFYIDHVQFYQIHGTRRKTFWDIMAYILEAISLIVIVVLMVVFGLQCRKPFSNIKADPSFLH